MKKQSFSTLPNCLCSILIVGLVALVSPSRAANAPGTKSGNAAVANHSTPEPQKSKTPAATSKPDTVKARLTELFNLCKGGNTKAAASYFVYRGGPDKSRHWKDTLRASDPTESRAIEGGCQEIKGILDLSQGHQFGPVKVERESEGEWHVVEVSFRQEDKTKKISFAFLLINGQFAIGDIDR